MQTIRKTSTTNTGGRLVQRVEPPVVEAQPDGRRRRSTRAATTRTNFQRFRYWSSRPTRPVLGGAGCGSDGASSVSAGISPVKVGVNGAVGSTRVGSALVGVGRLRRTARRMPSQRWRDGDAFPGTVCSGTVDHLDRDEHAEPRRARSRGRTRPGSSPSAGPTNRISSIPIALGTPTTSAMTTSGRTVASTSMRRRDSGDQPDRRRRPASRLSAATPAVRGITSSTITPRQLATALPARRAARYRAGVDRLGDDVRPVDGGRSPRS